MQSPYPLFLHIGVGDDAQDEREAVDITMEFGTLGSQDARRWRLWCVSACEEDGQGHGRVSSFCRV